MDPDRPIPILLIIRGVKYYHILKTIAPLDLPQPVLPHGEKVQNANRFF